MACSEEDTTRGFPYTNDMACRGRAQNAILANDQLLHTIGSPNLRDQLNELWIVEASIACNHKCTAFSALRYGKKDACDEGFTVVWLLEDCGLFAESRSGDKSGTVQLSDRHCGVDLRAWLLVGERFEGDCLDAHVDYFL